MPNTLDIVHDQAEMKYWLEVLEQALGTGVEKAIACEGCSPGQCFSQHIAALSMLALGLSVACLP